MDFTWKAESSEFVVVIFCFTIFYFIYHYDIMGAALKKCLRYIYHCEIIQPIGIFINRMSGVLLLGILPMLIITLIFRHSPKDFGFSLSIPPVLFLIVVALCAVLFPILLRYSKSPEARLNAPEAKPEKWNPLYFTINAVSWIIYLIAYEFCIRGFLLFSFVKIMDPWSSIFLMTSIYTIIHFNRGRGETSGCIVMGIIFGKLVLYTQSILLPIMIHIYIALTTDTLLILTIHRSKQ